VSRSRPHGQTLVLFCLTMLLVTLMVTLTLSFSMRVREKMEAQHVADLAAYSSAVATARTFNSIALMRRAQTAHLVAMSAVESLISWTTVMRVGLAPPQLAACPAAAAAVAELDEQLVEIQDKWNELDEKAGVQALEIQRLGGYLRGMQGDMYDRLVQRVNGGPESFAQKLAEMASQGSKWPDELEGGDTPVSVDELTHATIDGTSYGLDMAMATRGHEFITRRQGFPPFSGTGRGALGLLGALGGQVDVTNVGGSAYWGTELGHGGRADEADFTWAEDHAQLQITFPGCAPFLVRAEAGVRSTDGIDDTDRHWWTPAGSFFGLEDPNAEAVGRHTLAPVEPEDSPSTFIGGMTYNTGDDSEDNNWAQPKLFALVQRDYKKRATRPDPWTLNFSFRFTPSEANEFDNRGWFAGDPPEDISVQQALATGLAYYHRRGFWREPPNLWNPFWRATLVAADVDNGGDMRRGGNDVPNTVGVTTPAAAAAYRALINAGYKGVH
jgi:hypothetical protein